MPNGLKWYYGHDYLHFLTYTDRSPVEDGLVQIPEQWAWGSYRSYAIFGRGSS